MADQEEGGRVFQWTPEELDLRTLVEEYRSRLPIIVTVTQGYMGNDDGFIHDFCHWGSKSYGE